MVSYVLITAIFFTFSKENQTKTNFRYKIVEPYRRKNVFK